MEKRLVFNGRDQVVLESFTPADPGVGEVRIRTLATLLSSGTETIVLHRKFAEGTHWDKWVKYPFYPGYAAIGVIEQVGDGVENLRAGDRVAIRGAHASVLIADAKNCFPAPADLDAASETWFALAKIASMSHRGTGDVFGANVVILGAGPIGQMAARWMAAAGVNRLAAVDPVASRLDLLRGGVEAETFAMFSSGAAQAIADRWGENAVDIVIDTTGNAAVFADALGIARKFGKVVILGDTGTPAGQHLTSDVMGKGLLITATHDCHEDGFWNSAKAVDLWFRLVRDRRFRLDGLITHEFPPEDFKQAYDLANDPKAGAMGIVFHWEK